MKRNYLLAFEPRQEDNKQKQKQKKTHYSSNYVMVQVNITIKW